MSGFPTQHATTLFAYLVVHRGHFYAREALAGRFWGDRPDSVARKCLRTDLWRIRETLRRAGGAAEDCIIVHDDRVGFDSNGDYWVDLQEFEQRLNAASAAGDSNSGEAQANVERAIELYQGELLEGVYDDWCVHAQERARALFVQALEHSMRYHADRGDISRALEFGRRILERDPLRESIHREVMRLHVRAGNRPAALKQFVACADVLRRELDVNPMPETLALAEAMTRGNLDYHGEGLATEHEVQSPSPLQSFSLETLRAADIEMRKAEAHLRAARAALGLNIADQAEVVRRS